MGAITGSASSVALISSAAWRSRNSPIARACATLRPAFDRAWAEGQALTQVQAIELALQQKAE
jgi:hypothetical protein